MNKEKNSRQLPKDWKWVKLAEIGKIVSGGTPSTAIREYWNGNINWISPADLTGYRNKTISKGAKSISEIGLKNSSARLMPIGSVLFSSRAPIGYVAIAGGELCTNQGFKSIIPNNNVESDYIYYFLKGAKQIAENVASGTTFKEISLGKFSEIDFPLPPKSTQLAIVAKIEELFSELDKGLENLRLAQQQLKTYKQAVLKWAFEGSLTNEHLKEGELPEGWKMKKLNDIGTWKGGGTPSKANKAFWENGNIFWVSPKDMKSKIIYDTMDKLTLEAIEKSSTKLISKGSILFVVRSGILRRTLPVAITICDVTVNQDMQAFTPNGILTEYVYWYVKAKNEDIRRDCSKDGTTVESIESYFLRNYLIPICSNTEQNKIVQEIESRLSVADKMEESINQSLQQAEALKQSILKKAFEGKLL